jgi:hypothetical protein
MSNDRYERICRWSGNDHPMDASAADIELLPMYSKLQGHPEIEIIKHYAHDNVAHHTEKLHAENEALKERDEKREIYIREQREEIERLRAEVERLNRILGRIVEGDGESTLTIRAGEDAFAAAREYLRYNAALTGAEGVRVEGTVMQRRFICQQ